MKKSTYRALLKRGVALVASAALAVALFPASALAEFDEESTGVPAASEVTALTLDTPVTVSVEEAVAGHTWLSFTPATSGMYKFKSTDNDGDPFGALYEIYTEDDQSKLQKLDSNDDAGSSNFAITLSLTASQTYYLACSEYDDEGASYTVTVTAYDPYSLSNYYAEADDIPMGTEPTLESLDVVVYDDDDNDLTSGTNYKISGWLVGLWDESENEYVYSSLDSAPSAAGHYAVVLEGISPYHGTVNASFDILDPNDISSMPCDYNTQSLWTDANLTVEALGIELRDRFSGSTLTVGNGLKVAQIYGYDSETGSYSIDCGTTVPKIDGVYILVLEGLEPYHGEFHFKFFVNDPKNLINYSAFADHDSFWTGQPMTLARFGTITLARNNDASKALPTSAYSFAGWSVATIEESGDGISITYGDVTSTAPSSAGTYAAVFEGANGYTGNVHLHFTISDLLNIESYAITCNGDDPDEALAAYTGQPVTLASLGLSLSRADENSSTTTLKEGTDYKVTGWYVADDDSLDECTKLDKAPTEINYGNSYIAVIEGISPFTGKVCIYFDIVNPYDVESCTLTGFKSVYVYAGSAISIPVPHLTNLLGEALEQGTDFKYEIEDDDDNVVSSITSPGRYYIHITGLGKYAGTSYYQSIRVYDESDRESIANRGLFISGINASYAYTGKAIEPVPVIRYNYGDVADFEKGVDYTVSYSNNVTGPTATVTVNFTGYYKGSLSKTFQITGVPANKPAPAATPAAKKATSVTVNAKKVTAAAVASAMKKAGTNASAVTTITLGAKVKTIKAKAFAKCKKATTLVVKTKKLTKKSVKGSLKGSKVKTVKVKVGKKKVNKKFVKKYKKIFTKKVAGKKAKVK